MDDIKERSSVVNISEVPKSIKDRDADVDQKYTNLKDASEPKYNIDLANMPRGDDNRGESTVRLREKLAEYNDRITGWLKDSSPIDQGTLWRRDILRTVMERGKVDTGLLRRAIGYADSPLPIADSEHWNRCVVAVKDYVTNNGKNTKNYANQF